MSCIVFTAFAMKAWILYVWAFFYLFVCFLQKYKSSIGKFRKAFSLVDFKWAVTDKVGWRKADIWGEEGQFILILIHSVAPLLFLRHNKLVWTSINLWFHTIIETLVVWNNDVCEYSFFSSSTQSLNIIPWYFYFHTFLFKWQMFSRYFNIDFSGAL